MNATTGYQGGQQLAASPRRPKPTPAGFTLVELLVVIAIIGVMVGLLLPAVQAAREAARRMQCSNNLKQLALATHNYEGTYKVLPARMIGTGEYWANRDNNLTNCRRMSGWVSLMPFIEQQTLAEQISQPITIGGTFFPAWGPTPNSNTPAYLPWRVQVSSLVCPSDGPILNKPDNNQGRSNYRFSVGDSINRAWARNASPRGVFGHMAGFKFSAITDGTSNTALLSERLFGQDTLMVKQGIARSVMSVPENQVMEPLPCLGAVNPLLPRQYAAVGANWSGRRWANGMPVYAAFNTVFPPNSPSCNSNTSDETGNVVLPPTSNHPGGALVAFADGSVTFINESIDSGDPSQVERAGVGGGVSPYGVWGALGSKSGGEATTLP